MRACDFCHGLGHIWYPDYYSDCGGEFFDCENCDGTGELEDDEDTEGDEDE